METGRIALLQLEQIWVTGFMVRMVAGRGQRAAVSTRTLRRYFAVPAQSRASQGALWVRAI